MHIAGKVEMQRLLRRISSYMRSFNPQKGDGSTLYNNASTKPTQKVIVGPFLSNCHPEAPLNPNNSVHMLHLIGTDIAPGFEHMPCSVEYNVIKMTIELMRYICW